VTKNAEVQFAIPELEAGHRHGPGNHGTRLDARSWPAKPLIMWHLFPQIDRPENWARIVQAGHETYKYCFPILYLISIAFGRAAVIALLFLKDLEKYVNDHVAVCCEK
jgi:hypothetical protein